MNDKLGGAMTNEQWERIRDELELNGVTELSYISLMKNECCYRNFLSLSLPVYLAIA